MKLSADAVPENVEQAHEHFKKAWDYDDAGDCDRALLEFDAAARLAPEIPVYLAAKAQYLVNQKRYSEARETVSMAIKVGPRYAPAWFVLGLIELKNRRYRESANAFLKAAEYRPTHQTYTMLAGVQLELDPHEALQSAKKALELNPDWDEAQTVLEEAKRRIQSVKKS